jgi:hypothetical protein
MPFIGRLLSLEVSRLWRTQGFVLLLHRVEGGVLGATFRERCLERLSGLPYKLNA